MAQCRKATRSTVGGELSEQQVEEQFATIRNRRQHITREATLHTIQQYFEAAEEGIQVALVTVSLKCPISGGRVKDPVRTVACKHVDCFDLRTYLHFHTQLNRWTCPVPRCTAEARCDGLRVDAYMTRVLRDTNDRVQKVQVRTDGSFKAVLPPTATAAETMTINDEGPYLPGSIAEPAVKTEENNDSLVERMETDAFQTEQDQFQTYSLAVGAEEQLREALQESCERNATLRCELEAEKDRAVKAESDATRLREELAEKFREIDELKATNEELQSRLDATQTAAEAARQMNRETTACGNVLKDQNPGEVSSSLAARDAGKDAAAVATGCGPSENGQPQHDDCSESDASNLSLKLSDATAMENDPGGDEVLTRAPKQPKKRKNAQLKCPECDRVFANSSQLKSHHRTHSREKPYKCRHCDKAFADASTRRKHELIHTGEKLHGCHSCGKTFARPDTLHMHQRMHTGEKPYKCGQCDNAFTHSVHLGTHLHTHAGTKPHKCEVCGKGFAEPSSLKRHARLHAGEKPYKCEQCDKAFADRSARRTHERKHTHEKPYQCARCGKAFADPSNFRRHERTRHPEARPSEKAEKTA